MESLQKKDIKELCELCKTMACCPEHCCNVIHHYCYHNLVGYLSTGTEEVKKIKKQKAKDQKQLSEKEKEQQRPSEQTRANDGALIINYEVPYEEDEEKVSYSGGIKGIRALRQQRDVINDQIEEDLEESRNKFSKYEEKKR